VLLVLLVLLGCHPTNRPACGQQQWQQRQHPCLLLLLLRPVRQQHPWSSWLEAAAPEWQQWQSWWQLLPPLLPHPQGGH
jgi:hypothetical protein